MSDTPDSPTIDVRIILKAIRAAKPIPLGTVVGDGAGTWLIVTENVWVDMDGNARPVATAGHQLVYGGELVHRNPDRSFQVIFNTLGETCSTNIAPDKVRAVASGAELFEPGELGRFSLK